MENGLPTDSFSEQTYMLSLLVSAYFTETNLSDTGECGYLATSMQIQAESHTCRQPPPMSSSELTGDTGSHVVEKNILEL